MRLVRAFVRLLAILFITFFDYTIYLIGWWGLFWRSDVRIRWRHRLLRHWARTIGRVMNIDLIIKGNPPQPPFFLVSNHLSYLDVIIYYGLVDCIFIPKADIRSWPLIGFLTKSVGNIFINRQLKRDIPKVNRLIAERLTPYNGIILFPEGTSSKGADVLPFRPSLLEYPATHDLPVSYACISYGTPGHEVPAHLSISWWGGMTFAGHIWDMLKLSAIEATVVFGDKTLHSPDRKVLTDLLWQAVNDQFIPTVVEDES